MENQHRHITGYRELSENEIAQMNEIKAKASEVGVLIDKLRTDLSPDRPDQRWVSIGHTHLQEGFMALVRAIAKPGSF